MEADVLSAKLAALAHPTRRAMLQRLTQGDVTVQELAEPFGISAPGVTKHLKILEKAGLISRSRTAQTRPCRLEPAALSEVGTWVDQLRASAEQQLDQLEAYLNELQKVPPKKRRPATRKG